MRKLLLVITLAVSLSGCTTLRRACDLAIPAGATVQDILAVLIARGVAPERAAKLSAALAIGQIGVEVVCASIPPAPVLTPGS